MCEHTDASHLSARSWAQLSVSFFFIRLWRSVSGTDPGDPRDPRFIKNLNLRKLYDGEKSHRYNSNLKKVGNIESMNTFLHTEITFRRSEPVVPSRVVAPGTSFTWWMYTGASSTVLIRQLFSEGVQRGSISTFFLGSVNIFFSILTKEHSEKKINYPHWRKPTFLTQVEKPASCPPPGVGGGTGTPFSNCLVPIQTMTPADAGSCEGSAIPE